MGAVKFVVSGADIMRPGITDIDEDIHEGEIIVIIDENNKKPLAVGKALLSATEMKEQEKGNLQTSKIIIKMDDFGLGSKIKH